MMAIQVFSATKHQDREKLGESVSWWIKEHPTFKINEVRTMQSSDQSFHCVTIVLIGEIPK